MYKSGCVPVSLSQPCKVVARQHTAWSGVVFSSLFWFPDCSFSVLFPSLSSLSAAAENSFWWKVYDKCTAHCSAIWQSQQLASPVNIMVNLAANVLDISLRSWFVNGCFQIRPWCVNTTKSNSVLLFLYILGQSCKDTKQALVKRAHIHRKLY